jgi:hypothetical protein
MYGLCARCRALLPTRRVAIEGGTAYEQNSKTAKQQNRRISRQAAKPAKKTIKRMRCVLRRQEAKGQLNREAILDGAVSHRRISLFLIPFFVI